MQEFELITVSATNGLSSSRSSSGSRVWKKRFRRLSQKIRVPGWTTTPRRGGQYERVFCYRAVRARITARRGLTVQSVQRERIEACRDSPSFAVLHHGLPQSSLDAREWDLTRRKRRGTTMGCFPTISRASSPLVFRRRAAIYARKWWTHHSGYPFTYQRN